MEAYRQPGTVMTHFSILHPSSSNLTTPTINNDSQENKLGQANNTFVHKLYNMVLDDQYQHLIAWNYIGTSFIVCNIMEFSKDVLPKHFKHNNFSSFVRQLNMYGFHKINKSPRGHRTSAENQIWEFSHTKFLRNRTDLLGDIKRKAMESDTKGDIQTHLNMMQQTQSDMIQQINHLYKQLNRVVQDLSETNKKQVSQTAIIKQLAHHISQNNEGDLVGLASKPNDNHHAPSIFVTSPTVSSNNHHNNPSYQQKSFPLDRYSSPRSPSPLTVRTQNLPPQTNYQHRCNQSQMTGLGPLSSTFTRSTVSTPTGLMASDDDTSLYSPRTPTDTNNATHYGMALRQQ